MAGVAGRSGGHNRRSDAEHWLAGTGRADRRPAGATATTAGRLDDLRALYAHHRAHHATLTASLAGKFALANTERLQRAIRQETATILALSAAIERLERQQAATAAEPGDAFTEFDQ